MNNKNDTTIIRDNADVLCGDGNDATSISATANTNTTAATVIHLSHDTVHGIIPNIHSKEKFVSIINLIKKQHDINDDIYKAFHKYGGDIFYPDDRIEDALVKSLEAMFLSNGVIGSFVYEYDFCKESNFTVFEYLEEEEEEENKDSDGNTYDNRKTFTISDAESLYDYLIYNMRKVIINLLEDINSGALDCSSSSEIGTDANSMDSKDSVDSKDSSISVIESFAKIFESVYGGVHENADTNKSD